MYIGQTLAIPVLNRHITHSSGVCTRGGEARTTDCVMADAVRDRFPKATNVNVGGLTTDFNLDGRSVYLDHEADMESVIGAFDRAVDNAIDDARGGPIDLQAIYEKVRSVAPRVVHARVAELI